MRKGFEFGWLAWLAWLADWLDNNVRMYVWMCVSILALASQLKLSEYFLRCIIVGRRIKSVWVRNEYILLFYNQRKNSFRSFRSVRSIGLRGPRNFSFFLHVCCRSTSSPPSSSSSSSSETESFGEEFFVLRKIFLEFPEWNERAKETTRRRGWESEWVEWVSEITAHDGFGVLMQITFQRELIARLHKASEAMRLPFGPDVVAAANRPPAARWYRRKWPNQ